MMRSFWLTIVVIALMWPLATTEARESQAEDLLIHMEQDLLTVKAREVPHRRILEGLATQLDFELIISGSLDDRRSLEIEGRPWEEVLRRAISPASWAFMYDSPSGGEPRLAKVFVFAAKDGDAPPPRTPASPARIASPPPVPPSPEPPSALLPEPQEKGIDASLTELLASEDEEMRALALVGLATMGGEQAITALRQALQDKEPWIRETAVEALAEIGGDEAVQGLQQALRDDNPDVRRAAQEALIRLQPNPQ